MANPPGAVVVWVVLKPGRVDESTRSTSGNLPYVRQVKARPWRDRLSDVRLVWMVREAGQLTGRRQAALSFRLGLFLHHPFQVLEALGDGVAGRGPSEQGVHDASDDAPGLVVPGQGEARDAGGASR